MKTTFFKGAVVLVAAATMAGCAMKAPPYDASIDNVTALKRAGQASARLGSFNVVSDAKGGPNGASISLRGSTMTSPVGDTYAAYLADALKKELDLAKRYDPNATLEVSGSLLGTDMDAAMGTGTGYIEARFVVKKDGQVRFDKTKRGETSWESSFVGAIAIPAAQKSYPTVVQRLLSSLYSDADFQNALK